MVKSKMLFCRFIAIIMILISTFSTNVVANAKVKNDDIISPQYAIIQSNSTSISINGIKATCTATLKSQYSTSLKIKMELQKKKSSGYETVETWTSSRTGVSLAMSKSKNINLLYDYRLKATFTAGSESTVVYKYPS